jgi:hypothetical protein
MLYVVKAEFVPLAGARTRSDDELASVAVQVRSALSANSGAANGGSDRFVASAKVEAPDDELAKSWGHEHVAVSVRDALPDWRLESFAVRPA